MVPIKRKNIKSVFIPSPIYGSDKRPIIPVVERMITVIRNVVIQEREARDNTRRK